jgi:HD-like signal output (HDOD) protein
MDPVVRNPQNSTPAHHLVGSKAMALLGELKAAGKLPAIDVNVANICSLTTDPTTCVADLTAVILRDCALTSAVISAANSVIYAPDHPVKTISTAITLLGFEKIKSLSIGLVLIKQMSQNAPTRNLYRLFACSYFAGLFAMSLGRMVKYEIPEELLVGGVLNTLPRLLLANGFPERYANVEKRVVSEKISTNQACVDEFGVSYDSFAAEVIRYWNLPETAHRFQGNAGGRDRNSRLVAGGVQIADMMFGNLPGGPSALSNAESSLRMALGKPDFDVRGFVGKACAEDPNVRRFFKLDVKDVEMMVRIVEWGKVDSAQVAATLTYGAATDALQQPEQDPAIILGYYLTELALAVRKSVDINRLLLMAMEAIYRCVRPDLVLVGFVNKQSQSLEGRFILGSSSAVRPADFRVSAINKSSPVVECLLARQSTTVLVETDLPVPFLTALKIRTVRLIPIVVMDNAVGMFVLGREGTAVYTAQEMMWIEAIASNVCTGFERVKYQLSATPPGQVSK